MGGPLTPSLALWRTQQYFISQYVALCPGGTFRFNMTYLTAYSVPSSTVYPKCNFNAYLDGVSLGTSPIFASSTVWNTWEADVVATGATQNFTLNVECTKPGNPLYANWFTVFLDDLTLKRVDPVVTSVATSAIAASTIHI